MSLFSDTTHERKINIKKTESVEWECEFDFNSNKVPASICYVDDFAGWIGRAPKAFSAHPDIPELALVKIKGSRLDGNLIKVTLSYESNNPEATYPGREPQLVKRYALEPTTGEEPLLTNAIFKDISDAEKESIQQLIASSKTRADFATAETAVASEAGKKAISKIRKGTEAYLNPGLVWTERFTTKNLDDLDLGKILTTTNKPPGPCPSSGSERNWLFLSGPASPHDDGRSWDIEKRWQLSEKGKWDTDLYRNPEEEDPP